MSTTTLWKALAMVFAVALSLIFLSPALAGTDLHCPDKDNPNKIEDAEEFGELTFAVGTEICAKKGDGNTGVITVDDATKTLYEYLVDAGIDGAEGEGPSYYIVYNVPDDDPSPTPTPTTPDPDPTPTEPTETETPEPTESPEPSEQPSDEPTSETTDDSSDEVVETPDESDTLDELPHTGLAQILGFIGAALLITGFVILIATRK